MSWGAYRPLLVYAMNSTTYKGSHDFPTHFDPLDEVRYGQKPFQSTQHMWNTHIWPKEHENWAMETRDMWKGE